MTLLKSVVNYLPYIYIMPSKKKPDTKISTKPLMKKSVTKKPVTKKPVTKKPVMKKPVTKKPVTKKPTATIITFEKLPKTPCCTDVLKTGQAYSIPYGFRNLEGTNRLGTEPIVALPKPKIMNTESEIIPIKPKMVDTSTETVFTGKIIRVPKKLPPVSIETQTEPENIVEPFQPYLETLPFFASESTPRTPRFFPKRNSTKDLQNRYYAIEGEPYSGEKLTYTEFRALVEKLESMTKA